MKALLLKKKNKKNLYDYEIKICETGNEMCTKRVRIYVITVNFSSFSK